MIVRWMSLLPGILFATVTCSSPPSATADAGAPAEGGTTDPTTCGDVSSDPESCGACGRRCPPVKNGIPACAAGVCGSTCNTGFGECDADPASGCETELRTSAEHCGACGHACRSGGCRAGLCTPETVAQVSNYSENVLTDGESLWFVDEAQELWRVPKGATAASPVTASLGRIDGVNAYARLAVDDTFVFALTEETAILRVSKEPEPQVEPIEVGEPLGWLLASGGSDLFFLAQSGAVRAVPKSGGETREILAGTPNASLLDADDTSVYVVESYPRGRVLRAPKSGSGPVSVLYERTSPIQRATTSPTDVFVVTDAGHIVRIPKGGGKVTTLATEQIAYVLTADDEAVYWIDEVTRTARRCRVAGCAGQPEILGTDVGGASALAVLDKGLYMLAGNVVRMEAR
jgi:hypothetical protein